MTLYEINGQIAEIIENGFAYDEETGEVLDATDQLEALLLDRDTKVEHIGLFIKNARAEADAIKAEEKALADRRKRIEKKTEKLEKYVDYTIRTCYPDGFSTPKISYTFTKSKPLYIEDEDAFMAVKANKKYLNFKPSINKQMIKDLIKSGKKVKGCEIIEKLTLKIK